MNDVKLQPQDHKKERQESETKRRVKKRQQVEAKKYEMELKALGAENE
tara:strand:+ start:316 stop:459 length:144 start_codon:yes stop_codon:yes gene_type:complete